MSHASTTSGDLTAPRSRFYQGPYGRLFDELEPWRPTDAAGQPITDSQALEQWCLNVANTLMIESVEADGTPTLPRDIDEDAMDAQFGSSIPPAIRISASSSITTSPSTQRQACSARTTPTSC